MLARIHKSMEKRDGGFTLIELLVVMIIIGILAAIAIPVFLNQRAKAQDSAAKSDVSTIGKEIATYFTDPVVAAGVVVVPTIAINAAGRYELTVGTEKIDVGKASTNVSIAADKIVDDTTWCVAVKNPKGDKAKTGYKYSAANGLEVGGTCP
jgi:prepilin-type N-terminal cleavage/methylation domain-containing protein